MKMKEESEKFGLKLNIQETKIMASIMASKFNHFVENRWGKSGNSVRFHLCGPQNQ